jgi:hypothetical protein
MARIACGSARPADEATSGSRKPNGPAAGLDAVKRRAPALAGQDRKGAGQGAGGDDVAGCERRIDRIARAISSACSPWSIAAMPPMCSTARCLRCRKAGPNTAIQEKPFTVGRTNLVFLSAENAMKIRHISSAAPNDRHAPTAHIADKSFVERAETVLVLGVLWSGLAACMLGALSYDIAYWFGGS